MMTVPVLSDRVDGLQIEVVPVLVGDQDKIRFGQFPVVCQLAPWVHVNDLTAEGEHECPVADEGDLEIAR